VQWKILCERDGRAQSDTEDHNRQANSSRCGRSELQRCIVQSFGLLRGTCINRFSPCGERLEIHFQSILKPSGLAGSNRHCCWNRAFQDAAAKRARWTPRRFELGLKF